MYFIGLMSGTSMDAIDAALVQFNDGLAVPVAYKQYPIAKGIRERLLSVSANTSVQVIAILDIQMGGLFADAVSDLLHSNNISQKMIMAIGSHGQTVLHEPDSPHPYTLQIGDPNLIAARTGILTIADFRRADIAAGGQGAPLAPAFHEFQFRHTEKDRVILNIGGMANITILPADREKPVTGFDTGPGNIFMDEWIRKHQNQPMDKDGSWAASGTVQTSLLSDFLTDPYFSTPPPKTTGRDYFNLEWLNSYLERNHSNHEPEDVQATLLAFTARTIADAILEHAHGTKEVLICGGGVHNGTLTGTIRKLLPDVTIGSTEIEGMDPDAIEAVTFAWLAKCRIDEQPANLPAVTGARKKVLLGAVYKTL